MLYFTAEIFEMVYLRAFGAFFTAFFVALIFGKYIISWLKKIQKQGQPIRSDGPATHVETKQGTPTMGGVIIILAILVATLLWNRIDSVYIHIILVTGLLGGAIGFFDDFNKLRKNDIKGISKRIRLVLEGFLGLLLFFWIYYLEPTDFTTTIHMPFFSGVSFDLGYYYAIFAMVLLASTCNTVNFSDGLDGLAAGSLLFPMATFALIAWFASFLGASFIMEVPTVIDGDEIMIFCISVTGALLGFLWYNAYPAKVFMGDIGSLFLGSVLGAVAILLKQELLLVILAGVFVIEGISDVIQIYFYHFKNKRRFFLMAPLHHHYEKKGVHEVTIVIRFWILSILFSALALLSIYRPVE